MSATSEINETHSALESVVSEEISAAEYQAMNGLLKPMAMQFYLERFPYLQMVDSASTAKDDVSKVAFERSESEWLIHRYGDVAMSASAGEYLFTDGQAVEGMDKRGAEVSLVLRSDFVSPITLYAVVNKSLTFNVKNDKIEAGFDGGACLSIPALKWKHVLENKPEQMLSFTPKQVGEFPIHDPAGQICGHLLVLEAPKPLPKRGTLMHSSDVRAKRMVQIAVEAKLERHCSCWRL